MKLVIFICLIFFFPSFTQAMELPVDITAHSAIVIDLDADETIYTKNVDDEVVLASLTKIMTAYTVLENVENLDKKITITEEDLYNLYGFTNAGLEKGDKVSYLDLLYAMMLPSGADASQALAIHTAGSTEAFTELMNKEARNLGLRHTHFADSFGRDDANISTAREISYLLKTALENPTFKKIFTTDYYTLSNSLRVINYTDSIATFHGLDYTWLTGSKSGYTEVALLLLASTAYINDTNYLIVVCKSTLNDYLSTHILDTYKILNYLKEGKYSYQTILKKGTILTRIPVEEGTMKEYMVIANQDVKAYLNEEEALKLTYDYHLTLSITPNHKKGDYLGFIDFKIGNERIDTYHVYLKDTVFSIKTESKMLIIFIVLLLFIAIALFGTNIMLDTQKKKRKRQE